MVLGLGIISFPSKVFGKTYLVEYPRVHGQTWRWWDIVKIPSK